MDIERYLIILNGEDKTDKVKEYNFTDSWKVNVQFWGSDKIYGYSKKNIQIYSNPIEINIDENSKTLVTGDIFNVKKILKFDSYCKIIFNDDSYKTVPAGNLKLTEKIGQVSEDKFNYFKEISKIVSVKTDDGTALLTKEYEKVNFVENDTALYQYLNSQNNEIKEKVNTPLIFPFGSNKSQYKAVENAMKNQMSVIEGPPGTGKTQTILNIISNIIIRGKTVAVVSNNNEATANVFEKLKEKGYKFICATLGKKENKEHFIENQMTMYPTIEIEKPVDIKEIATLNKKLDEIFEIKNKRAVAKELLEETKIQHKYFNENETVADIFKVKSVLRLKSKEMTKLQVELEDMERSNNKIKFWFKLKAIIVFGIGDFKFYKLPISKIIKVFSKIYFLTKENELQNFINNSTKKLEMLEADELLKKLEKQSNTYFLTYLKERYIGKNYRRKYELGELYIHSDEFIKDYPIIFSTTHSIKECLNPSFKYDYIIMDEASQVDLITGTLALSCAKNAIIVGDRKQLPNVVTPYNRREIEELTKKYKISNNYNFLKECFLTSVMNSIPEVPNVLLKEHYRCHPKIIQFSNKKFYNDELIILTEDKNEKDVMKAFVTVEGNHARGHFNQRQIEVIRDEVLPELNSIVESNQIGIVSPYNDQKDGLIDLKLDEEIKIDTVHKYQGREKDAIVITTVDNQISEFVDDPKLLNVAVTRAKKFLRLVASKDISEGKGNLSDLIKYIQYNNFELVESKLKSIYDLLYKSQREERLKYLKGKKRISDYDSENITYNFIKEIIQKNEWNNLDIESHIPLNDLLKDLELLNEEEKKYASNDWTHIDFVIYNKMDKKMVMAIEVDGYYFHNKGTKQKERDKLKDSILQKYDVPLIRLKTTGSGEEKILEGSMREFFEEKENGVYS
ncbi:MAG: DUF2726 domain-containing protein [Clostridia bacterium]|nr:DUF2726 domain-containing protein [Clostridia bacterium]